MLLHSLADNSPERNCHRLTRTELPGNGRIPGSSQAPGRVRSVPVGKDHSEPPERPLPRSGPHFAAIAPMGPRAPEGHHPYDPRCTRRGETPPPPRPGRSARRRHRAHPERRIGGGRPDVRGHRPLHLPVPLRHGTGGRRGEGGPPRHGPGRGDDPPAGRLRRGAPAPVGAHAVHRPGGGHPLGHRRTDRTQHQRRPHRRCLLAAARSPRGRLTPQGEGENGSENTDADGVVLTATGEVPTVAFGTPGPATLAPAGLTLTLASFAEDGAPTTPPHLTVVCAPADDKERPLARITVRDGASPTTPARTPPPPARTRPNPPRRPSARPPAWTRTPTGRSRTSPRRGSKRSTTRTPAAARSRSRPSGS